MLSPITDLPQPALIRSFVRRETRLTTGQKQALMAYLPAYGCFLAQGQINPLKIFGRSAAVTVEIGFGMGDSLLAMAASHPEQDYIGIEVYRPGVGSLLSKIAAHQLKNIRIFAEDAVLVLRQCIANESLSAIYIFFPDPWPKQRHHKRRLIQPGFIDLLKTKLCEGGVLHLATDWEAYAQHMLMTLTQAPSWENQAGFEQFHPRPDYRPLTKFEQRGQRLGHQAKDLLFRKKEENLLKGGVSHQ